MCLRCLARVCTNKGADTHLRLIEVAFLFTRTEHSPWRAPQLSLLRLPIFRETKSTFHSNLVWALKCKSSEPIRSHGCLSRIGRAKNNQGVPRVPSPLFIDWFSYQYFLDPYNLPTHHTWKSYCTTIGTTNIDAIANNPNSSE